MSMETDAVPNREPLPFTDEEYSARLAAVRWKRRRRLPAPA